MTQFIDLRSDTVTRPTAAMRAAMAAAEVGDDVIETDPTADALQQRVAELLGKEAAIFMPSGSMTNQIAIRLHCGRGDEFLCEADCHVYNYEQAAFAQLSGIVARTIQGTYGMLQPQQLLGMIRPPADNLVRTRLVALENTHNRGGGTVQSIEHVRAICDWAHSQGLVTPGWRAAVQCPGGHGIDLSEWSAGFDSVSVCFSKGLELPVGSAAGRFARFYPRGTAGAQAVRRRHAAGGYSGGRRAVCLGASSAAIGRGSSACPDSGWGDSPVGGSAAGPRAANQYRHRSCRSSAEHRGWAGR